MLLPTENWQEVDAVLEDGGVRGASCTAQSRNGCRRKMYKTASRLVMDVSHALWETYQGCSVDRGLSQRRHGTDKKKQVENKLRRNILWERSCERSLDQQREAKAALSGGGLRPQYPVLEGAARQWR